MSNMSFHYDVSGFVRRRELECQEQLFVKTNRLKMLFVASNVQFQKLVRYKKQESANSMKSLA